MSSLRDHYVDVLFSCKELIKAIEENTESSKDEHGNIVGLINKQYISEELEELKNEIGYKPEGTK